MRNDIIFNPLLGIILPGLLVLLLCFNFTNLPKEIALENTIELELIEDFEEKDSYEEYLHLYSSLFEKNNQSKAHTSTSNEFHYYFAIKSISILIVSPPPRYMFS